MIRELFCVLCGASRTIDLARRHLSAGAPMACFGCGHTIFTTCADNAPARPTAWLLTAFDKRLLLSYGIAIERREVVG